MTSKVSRTPDYRRRKNRTTAFTPIDTANKGSMLSRTASVPAIALDTPVEGIVSKTTSQKPSLSRATRSKVSVVAAQSNVPRRRSSLSTALLAKQLS
ncbi:hypothetical protein SARC_16451, partial [Sphaeroforma arctica JP610]